MAKKKIRVALRKNRHNRTRANDLTQAYRDDAPAASSAPGRDRVRPKGEMSRHRTIIEDDASARSSTDGAEHASRRVIDTDSSLQGRVLSIHGLVSSVQTADGRVHPCQVRRLLKTLEIEGRSVIAVGDRVWFRPSTGGGVGLIEKVEPRTGVIARGYRHRRHVIAANVDQLLIVSALAEPGLKLGLVDRYLVSAECGGVRPVIVLNKADLVDMAEFQWVVGLYAQLGYETLTASAADRRGLDRLKELLSTGVTAVSGQSGVGKSSLLNAIQPGLNLRVAEVSDWTAKGRHTTTSAELIALDAGGFVVDTPGLRQFELWGVAPDQIGRHFREFRAYIHHCRFPDCSHSHETGCAVKEAVHLGRIHPGRYDGYRKLLDQKSIDDE